MIQVTHTASPHCQPSQSTGRLLRKTACARTALHCTLAALLFVPASVMASIGFTSSASEPGDEPQLAAATSSEDPGAPDGFRAPQQWVADGEVWQQELTQRLSHHSIMGYSAVLVRGGQMVKGFAEGHARNTADGLYDPFINARVPVPMSIHTPVNIGSVQKVVTGMLLFRVLHQKAKNENTSVNALLDAPMAQYLPTAWQAVASAQVKTITLRDMMEHRSGFRTALPPTTSAGDLESEEGQQQSPGNVSSVLDFVESDWSDTYGKKQYHNGNFELMAMIIPRLIDTDLAWDQDQILAHYLNKGPENTLRDRDAIIMVGDAFAWALRTELHEIVDNPVDASCDPESDWGDTRLFAKGYTGAEDATPGWVYSDIESAHFGYCNAAGGWHYSAFDLAKLFAYLQADEDFLPLAHYDAWYDEKMSDQDARWNTLLVYNGLNGLNDGKDFSGLTSKSHWWDFPGHGGGQGKPLEGQDADDDLSIDDQDVTEQAIRAAVVQLPFGYHALVLTNSPGSTGRLEQYLIEAFDAALSLE